MLKCQKKWLELFLKKFLLCTFRNNVESETVLYLTNGRKRSRINDFLLKVRFFHLDFPFLESEITHPQSLEQYYHAFH